MAVQDSELLKQILKSLNALEANQRAEKTRRGRVQRVSHDRKNGLITSEEMILNFKKLSVELEHSLAGLKKTRSITETVSDAFKNIITPAASLRRAFETSTKQLKEHLRHQDSDFREMAVGTQKAFQTIMAKGGDLAKAFESLSKLHDNFGKSFSNFDIKKSDLSKQNDARIALEKIQKEEQSHRGKMTGMSKDDLDYDRMSQQHAKLLKAVNAAEAVLDGIQTQNKDYKVEYEHFIKEITDLEQQNIKVLGKITEDDLKYENFLRLTTAEQGALLKQLDSNLLAVNQGINGFNNSVTNYNNALKDGKKRFVSALATLGAGLVRGAVTSMNDYLARQKYNVTQANPLAAGNMGMSGADLAEMIGNNKQLFRLMGKGDENAPLNNGQFKQLQDAAKIFGVNGKEAAEMAISFGNLNMELGNSTATITDQMDAFKKLNGITGLSVDELQDFYRDLNKTGAITALNSKYAAKSEKDRVNAINNEIATRVKLNQQLGYNLDNLQKQNQLATNQQFADIEEVVRRSIGVKLAVSDYNKKNPNSKITGQAAADQELTQGAANLLDPDRYKQYLQNKNSLIGNQSERRTALDQAQVDATNRGSRNPAMAGATDRIRLGIESGFANDIGGQDSVNSYRQAQEKAAQTTGQNLSKEVATQFGKYAGKDFKDLKVNEFTDATDTLTKSLNDLGKYTALAAEKMEGFNKSPIGSVASLKGYSDLISSAVNLLASGRLASILAKGGGSAAGTLTATGIGSAVSTALSTSVKALPVAVNALGVGVAAILGTAIGTVIRDAVDDSKRGKNIDKYEEARYGDKSPIMAATDSLFRKYIQPVLDPMGAATFDGVMENSKMQARISQRADLMSHTLASRFGPQGSAGFDPNGRDKDILQGLASGAINAADLKSQGASADYLNKLQNYNPGKAVLSPDDVDDGSKKKLVEDSLKATIDLRDMTKKQIEDDKLETQQEKLSRATSAEVNKRVDQAKASQATAKSAAMNSIPGYNGT